MSSGPEPVTPQAPEACAQRRSLSHEWISVEIHPEAKLLVAVGRRRHPEARHWKRADHLSVRPYLDTDQQILRLPLAFEFSWAGQSARTALSLKTY